MVEGKKIEKVNFNEAVLEADYAGCTFVGCDFSYKSLGSILFEDCTFESCNFTMVKMTGVHFSKVLFKECKMSGVDFTHCSKLSSFNFEGSFLRCATFFQRKMVQTRFSGCDLQEVYFEETDLSGTVFKDCDMAGAVFFKANLEKADFSSSYNYALNPQTNRLKKTRFSQSGLRGLVSHLDIDIVDD